MTTPVFGLAMKLSLNLLRDAPTILTAHSSSASGAPGESQFHSGGPLGLNYVGVYLCPTSTLLSYYPSKAA